jgi:hypothetical protein
MNTARGASSTFIELRHDAFDRDSHRFEISASRPSNGIAPLLDHVVTPNAVTII